MNRFRDNAIQNSTRRLTAATLDLVQPEIETFDPPTRKPYPRTKDEADRMNRCRDMAIRNFPKCEVGSWSSVLNIHEIHAKSRPTLPSWRLPCYRYRMIWNVWTVDEKKLCSLIHYYWIFRTRLHVHLKKWTLKFKLLYLLNHTRYFNKICRICGLNPHL